MRGRWLWLVGRCHQRGEGIQRRRAASCTRLVRWVYRDVPDVKYTGAFDDELDLCIRGEQPRGVDCRGLCRIWSRQRLFIRSGPPFVRLLGAVAPSSAGPLSWSCRFEGVHSVPSPRRWALWESRGGGVEGRAGTTLSSSPSAGVGPTRPRPQGPASSPQTAILPKRAPAENRPPAGRLPELTSFPQCSSASFCQPVCRPHTGRMLW